MTLSLPAEGKQGRNEALDVITGMMIRWADVRVIDGDFSYILEIFLFSVAQRILGTEHFYPLLVTAYGAFFFIENIYIYTALGDSIELKNSGRRQYS